MFIIRTDHFTWESQEPEEPTIQSTAHFEPIEEEPTTPSTARFEPVEERYQSAAAAAAAAYDGDDPLAEESLQKLKDWIDYPPPFDQKDNTSPVYLFKPEFTFPILMEALIYAVGKYKALMSEFRTLATIAVMQYKQDISGWSAQYGLGGETRKVCLQKEIDSENWEIELRNTELTDEEKKLLRRTIVAVARIAEKMEVSNYDLKLGIGMLQGDLEGQDEEE